MASFILRLYKYMKKHRFLCFMLFVVLSCFFILQVTNLNYKEDISDFLPLDDTNHKALNVYQNISGANNIITIFHHKDSINTDPEVIVDAINAYISKIEALDIDISDMQIISQVDIEQLTDISEFVYANIPYFLQKKDYQRIDSLLAEPSFVNNQLRQDKQMLMLPGLGLLTDNISRDPLNLFTPVISRLPRASGELNYETYDGYIFSPDMQKAIVVIKSPYGPSETEKNGNLIVQLQSCTDLVCNEMEDVQIHITGGPAIAVGNAIQIKHDSIVSVVIAIGLILLLLLFSFRNVKNLLLIVLSIGWGWMVGLGGLALFHDNVSIIVLGISSVILGIAVNYPLHLIAHLYHCDDIKSALREIVSPLVVGNITTVCAFLSLVPLDSIALRDLGLFSSFLLIGTIIFVLFFLPHLTRPHKSVHFSLLEKASAIKLENKPIAIIVVIVMTFVFGYYSLSTEFDSNISHINYMSESQKDDMAFFQKAMTTTSNNQNIYLVSSDHTLDKALDKSLKAQSILQKLKANDIIVDYSSCSHFLLSEKEQQKRLDMWNQFISRYSAFIKAELEKNSSKEGFSHGSFDDFYSILSFTYSPQGYEHFKHLANKVFASNLSIDSISQCYEVVDVLSVSPSKINEVKNALTRSSVGSYFFDVQSMNSALANALSDNFNYIGWVCGFIVFFFLWFSLGSIELAILSFLPMAISWIWILGIMALIGIKFNIVNVILATFIFGQGDDYTIFMTEGACYEYAYRKKMLSSYKSSIILSAMIMFIGIGSLIVAKHPALHSLAEVTIVGMFSVVLMAYIFPPFIFNILTKKNNKYRIRPISFVPLLSKGWVTILLYFQAFVVYILGIILVIFSNVNEQKRIWLRNVVHRMCRFTLRIIPGVSFEIRNTGKDFSDNPALITCNYQSKLDIVVLMALSPTFVFLTNQKNCFNGLLKRIIGWLNLCTIAEDANGGDLNSIQSFISSGYSLVTLINRGHNIDSSNQYYYEEASSIAQKWHLDIIPIVIHGTDYCLHPDSEQLYSGKITILFCNRINYCDSLEKKDVHNLSKTLKIYYDEEYRKLVREIETSSYFSEFVIDRYKYKGVEITKGVKKNLSKYKNYSKWIDASISMSDVFIVDSGYGEFALLYSLVHKDKKINVIIDDELNASLIKNCANGIVDNLEILTFPLDTNMLALKKVEIFLVEPNEKTKIYFSEFKPIII